ncbi:MAG: sigma-54-dependent Fis family transcriptional regulator, partial [Deltaproteobacteria bacterium]|nr:sigma-54-dependent Fis family transcriptional regulator [Deltaproteobacteria bacterium]
NCAALSETLLESELFGYEKGAFTGASTAKAGLLEAAAGGTILLDEIGEMPPGLQTRLLRALEAREVTRVGAVKPRAIDVRFIAATNRDLEAEIETKTFRQDLYFRLNGISLTLPPLRERPDEIEPLARQFLAEASGPVGQPPPRLSADALDILRVYVWPGNIRELRNVMERALVLCEGDEITTEHLPVEKMRLARLVIPAAPAPTGAMQVPQDLGQHGAYVIPSFDDAATTLAENDLSPDERAERRHIIQVMDGCAGSQTRAAEKLGMSRGTLIARLKQYRIPRPRAPRT